MPLTPNERSMRARIAANERWSKHDSRAHAAKMRAAQDVKWLDRVDPDRELSEAERQRRAHAARRAHFQRLAYRSAKARRERAELTAQLERSHVDEAS